MAALPVVLDEDPQLSAMNDQILNCPVAFTFSFDKFLKFHGFDEDELTVAFDIVVSLCHPARHALAYRYRPRPASLDAPAR